MISIQCAVSLVMYEVEAAERVTCIFVQVCTFAQDTKLVNEMRDDRTWPQLQEKYIPGFIILPECKQR